jgi:cytochrome c-type biogenesis protein CcmH/NrfF
VSDRRPRSRLWVRAGLPLAVLAVALVIGSGVLSGKPQTRAERAASIEAVVRCPSCIDVSVAQSDQTTALAVRHQIEREVAQGRTTARIEQSLVAQYGQTILLEPPDAGGFAVIWILPIAGAGVALGVVGVLFWRRSRQFADTRTAQITADTAPLTDDAAQITADIAPLTDDAAQLTGDTA